MKSKLVSDIMTNKVVYVSPDQKIIDVKHIYEKQNFHHHIPVMENNKLVGMISLIDFMYRIKGAGLDDATPVYNELTVKDIMTPNPDYLTTSATVEEAAAKLAQGKYHAIPIVDQEKVVGIVSTADLIQFFMKK